MVVKPRSPVVVTGLPVTPKMLVAGTVRPTEVTAPDPDPHAAPAATRLPLASICTQSPEVIVPLVVANVVVLPDFEPAEMAEVPFPMSGAPEVRVVAPVPPLPTGSVPETSELSATEPQVGAPDALPWSTCALVPSDPSVAGAPPTPPPSTIWFWASAADEASAVPFEK